MPVVAVDGPSGSGKSSVSREVARRLGLRYLDTGAMYRAVTVAALRSGIDLADQDAVARRCAAVDLPMPTDPDAQRVICDGDDVTDEIRSHAVTAAVSAVATNLAVRADLRRRQREIIDTAREAGGIVVEGRDITTVVAPDADVRILLTASEQARLERRALEVHGHAAQTAVEELRDVVLRRDADDATVSTFHVAADGVVEIDSSALDFAQTVAAVLGVVAAAGVPDGVRS